MGCDIHLYAERLRDDGTWESADRWTPDEDDYEDGRLRVKYGDGFYSGRNYDLFAILADVRNGRGFAGCYTGAGFVPIAEPRGLPESVSPQVRTESDWWAEDGHSRSHLTVAELIAYDWTQETTLSGVVGPQGWAEWLLRGRPEGWSGDVSGGGVRNFSNEEFSAAAQKCGGSDEFVRALLRSEEAALRSFHAALGVTAPAGSLRFGGSAYTRVEWGVTYASAAQEFLCSTMPRLWRLGPPDRVRIIFWFDN